MIFQKSWNSIHRETLRNDYFYCMKYTIIFLVFCCLFSCVSNTDTEKNDDTTISKAEIDIAKNLIQGSFDDLWAGMDSTKILDYHTADFKILENGEIWDNERITQYMRESLGNTDRPKRINEMEYISIDKYGPSIQIAYDNYGSFYQGDSLLYKLHWLESALAVPTEDGWRLKMMHSTFVRH